MGRSIFLDHPALKGGLIDLSETARDADATLIRDELLDPQHEDCVALRDGRRYVSRLESYRPGETLAATLARDGAYLITGGLGAVGLEIARHFAARRAGCLVLMGRRAPSDAARQAIRRCEEQGSRVFVIEGDVADEASVTAAITSIAAHGFTLKGIVHAAGINDQRSVRELAPDHVRATMAPKMVGAVNLHRLTHGIPLDFFICCSSIASVWGSARQAHYSAANAFLDGLAEYRRSHGLPALAINWGPWNAEGMSTRDGGGERVANGGLRLIEPEVALLTLDQLMGSRESRITVADVDWARLKDLYQAHGRQPLFDRVGDDTTTLTNTHAPLVAELQATDAAHRFERLARPLESAIADVLGLDGDHALDRELGFFDMGVDSLMSIQIKDRIRQLVGRDFPASLCFDYPTVTTLVHHLLHELFPADAPPVPDRRSRHQHPTAGAVEETAVAQLTDDEIAVLIESEMKALDLA
jgi:NAD(P)-dependent dehydrogenase (short-subunit alcohol dehydrogenase family)/acyl carrier protein